MVVVVGEGQFFLHPVGLLRRRFTLASSDTDGVSNVRGVFLLIDDGVGTAPWPTSSLMSISIAIDDDGSNENSKMLGRSFMIMCLLV